MRSPKDMRNIQIDVTNACIRRCSNCTRFCGNHKKPFFMSFETFKRAVDSLEGFTGTIGIMGGEPTLHPDFEKMAQYLAEKCTQKHTNDMLRPQVHFMDSIHDLEYEHVSPYVRKTGNIPGLWSSMGGNYKKYYETIQDTIQRQVLNDHINVMYHQPALITRKELQIPDEQWFVLRDKCWVQNKWSASVTPKGAFFCEIAGALDMLFDGPGGWKIEPGWWKKTPEEFGEQLNWCEMCGLACDTFMRNANEEVYDVSPYMYEKLVEIESPLVGTEHINVLKLIDGKIPEENKAKSKRFGSTMPYTESYSDRYNEDGTNLMYKELVGVIICFDVSEISAAVENIKFFSEVYVYTEDSIIDEIKKHNLDGVNAKYFDSKIHTFGYVIYEALKRMDYNRYALVLSGNVTCVNVLERMEKLVLNPGTLLYSEFKEEFKDDYFCAKQGSEVALFNATARSIRDVGWDNILQIQSLNDLVELWQSEKVIAFAPESERIAVTAKIEKGKRYAVYGSGERLPDVINKIKDNGADVVAVIDSSNKKIGTEICGFVVQDPNYLEEHRDMFDMIMIFGGLYYREIKERVIKMGFSEEELAWI